VISGHERRARGRAAVRAVAVAAVASALALMSVSPAQAAITSSDAAALASAMAAPGSAVTGGSWVTTPTSTIHPYGVSDASLGGFPTEGSSFSILTTGNVQDALQAPPKPVPSIYTELGGGNVRGNTDYDVTVLKVDFTVGARMNCVRFDFRYFTSEYPHYMGQTYNDAFIAELDHSTWTTNNAVINAPDNFAFDPGHKPITVNSLGDTGLAASPNDVMYGGATPILTAAHEVTAGNHSLYLSIFDQGDQKVDSAVFLDNLVIGHAADPSVQCAPGAEPKKFAVTMTPATASKQVGGSHTVTATVKSIDSESGPVSGGKVLFTTSGANTATGQGTTDASGVATFSYSGAKAGDDAITACYDVNNNGTCDKGEPTATVAATWTAVPLPTTGKPTGLIAGAGALALALGGVGYVLIRRRRVRFVAE
jgi:LPXTG-motif cell wall-anchored protein